MFDFCRGKSVLITGGTGSFGKHFVEQLLGKSEVSRVVVYSRDEMKQWEMARNYETESRLRFFLGDVRDKERLLRAFDGIDIVIHAAASKIVPLAEYNPFECIKTNIVGAMNVVDAAIDRGVHRVIALSTDKACNPANLYGATKLASDKIFVAANSYSASGRTKFSVVRYGNVMGSRGSVIPLFFDQKNTGVVTITDERMTRFMITLDEAAESVLFAMANSIGGDIFIRKVPSMRVVDVAKAIAPGCRHDLIGIRPGEKLHEALLMPEEAQCAHEYENYFIVYPQSVPWDKNHSRLQLGKPTKASCFDSSSCEEVMTTSQLLMWARDNGYA